MTAAALETAASSGVAQATDHIIVLNCCGRGGSGIVWRMIGSSPDVVMTTDEWHVAVFGRKTITRKVARAAFQRLGVESFEPLRRYARRRTIESRSPGDLSAKPEARAFVVKLMDYHLVFSRMISRSFRRTTFVNLTRHPYGQCESLIRSGLTLGRACRWYRDVAQMMVARSDEGAIDVRFEDVVSRPLEACDRLYKSLGVRWAEDERFVFKVKPYGARRTGDIDVSGGAFVRTGADDVGKYIDASVLSGATERLSDAQRREIWRGTGEIAARFGYDESAYAGGAQDRP